MKVKVSDLAGAALDWVVAQNDPMCAGLDWEWNTEFGCMVGIGIIQDERFTCLFLSAGLNVHKKIHLRRRGAEEYAPSATWAQVGPLIEREGVSVVLGIDGGWDAYMGWLSPGALDNDPPGGTGATPLIAAMRAIVAAELGDEVEIPEELCSLNPSSPITKP